MFSDGLGENTQEEIRFRVIGEVPWVAEVPYYSVSLVSGLSDSKYCVGTPILCCSVCVGPQSQRYRDEGSRFVESEWRRSRARVCCF